MSENTASPNRRLQDRTLRQWCVGDPTATPDIDRLIITAASERFAPSLLGLLGALTLNWPGHPAVIVYDIGLAERTLAILAQNDVCVRRVPPFCRHWRNHFTWKIWCLMDAPALNVLWMDAGTVVLRPLDEILNALDRQGYFVTTNYELLDWEASDEACRGCGVPPAFRRDKLTLPATLVGIRKAGVVLRALEEAFAAALTETNIAATAISHRHDQAILSLTLYKHLGSVVIADGAVYLGKLLPTQVPGQKVWVHRGNILWSDVTHLARHISVKGKPYVLTAPYSIERARARSDLYRTYWCFGTGDIKGATKHIRSALDGDPQLVDEPAWLMGRLHMYSDKLASFFGDRVVADSYLDWACATLSERLGERAPRLRYRAR